SLLDGLASRSVREARSCHGRAHRHRSRKRTTAWICIRHDGHRRRSDDGHGRDERRDARRPPAPRERSRRAQAAWWWRRRRARVWRAMVGAVRRTDALDAESIVVGDAWVETVRTELRESRRRITGGWPGT